MLILLFNSISIFLGSIDIRNTENQIILIIVNALLYTVIYKQLSDHKSKKNKLIL